MWSLAVTCVTPEEYLERERAAGMKHEYWDGEIVAMAGGPPIHSFIISNIHIKPGARLRSGCRMFNSDLRVRVRRKRLFTYPDITIVCGEPQYAGDRRDTVPNPTVIIEVLSPTTAGIDRGKKAFLYRELPSLKEILFVEPDPVQIEHDWRLPNGHWELESISDAGATLRLAAINCDLPVAEIYRKSEIFRQQPEP